MTGQTVSPRSLAASISATRSATRASTTAKTSSTVRPDASMRARIAALISRIAALRSAGVVSQCGSARWMVVIASLSFRKDSLLKRNASTDRRSRQES